MAKMMNDEQRLTVLEGYDPKQHLIEVAKDKGKPVFYYPAAWRLYELRLRHPHFTLEAEIVHMDIEKNMVIVQAVGYDGLDYASSNLKGKALKQGKLSDLDKVETKAKSRVVRDVGIGTEYALDMVADETDATHDTTPTPRQNGRQDGTPAVESLKPSEVDGLKTYVGKVFKFKAEDFDTRWLAYKKFRLNRHVDDMNLTLMDATTLRDFAEKEEAKNGAVAQAS